MKSSRHQIQCILFKNFLVVVNCIPDLFTVLVYYQIIFLFVEGKFSEEYCKKILRDILNAIFYLHETKNIAHRDLKLANIMFTDKSPDADLKLIDFGLSKV